MFRIDREDPSLAKQLQHLEHINQFLCQITTAILLDNQAFESVWSTANEIYDRYHSTQVRLMSHPDFDASGTHALNA
jgi:hypothetical protein